MKRLKEFIKSKKKPLIISFFIIFLLGYLFFGCSINFANKSWSCSGLLRGEIPRFKEVIYKTICSLSGGLSFSNHTLLGSVETYACIRPLPDYGKVCNFSSECMGGCEYAGIFPDFCYKIEENKYRCVKGVEGQCSPRDYGIFDKWTEVSDNVLIFHKGGTM